MSFFKHLESYRPFDEREQHDLEKITEFLESTDNPFSRTNLDGHITASAWVINTDMTKTLLVHHKKLGHWLMPGGHADGSEDILAMARQEVWEETGVKDTTAFSDRLFDIDVHRIPAAEKHGKKEPEHIHYDVRYLLVADETTPLEVSDESHDVKWVPLADVLTLHPGWVSGARMIEKTKRLRAQSSARAS